MKKTVFLGLLVILLAFFPLACGGDDTTEPYTGPKTIKITGFNEEGFTPNGGYILSTDKAPDEWPPIAVGQDTDTFFLNGQTITVELIDWTIFMEDWTTKVSWTGNGEYIIVIKGNPGKSGGDGANYVYSTNGTSPTPVKINNAITTLEWSKFIYHSDYTAG